MLDSRLGKVLIIVYTLLAFVMYIAAFACGLDSCGHYLILPIMPWAYIFAQDLGFSLPWAVYPILVLLNISVAYALGVVIEWLYHTYKDRRR